MNESDEKKLKEIESTLAAEEVWDSFYEKRIRWLCSRLRELLQPLPEDTERVLIDFNKATANSSNPIFGVVSVLASGAVRRVRELEADAIVAASELKLLRHMVPSDTAGTIAQLQAERDRLAEALAQQGELKKESK